jgi:SAM-dependent methyltransferase
MSEFQYLGNELDVFLHATNWKSYVRSKIRGHLVGKVLEVGAGVGAVTQCLYDGTQKQWVCLEPDRALVRQIPVSLLNNPEKCETRVGTLADLNEKELFDCILYFDVLEHIQEDADELLLASKHLAPDGRLVILSPALPALFSPFDAAIGHHRRYTRESIRAIAPNDLEESSCVYLDWAGALVSLGNRLLLRSAAPKKGQILFWDRFLVPISRLTDVILGHFIGRSILVVWRKPAKADGAQRI